MSTDEILALLRGDDWRTSIDSSVLVDILMDDPVWFDWSLSQLDVAALKGPLLINDTAYAETSTQFRRLSTSSLFWPSPI